MEFREAAGSVPRRDARRKVAERRPPDGGLTRLRLHDLHDPANLYDDVRP